MAGVFLIAAGFLRLGHLHPSSFLSGDVGFTAGIAVIIFASQPRICSGITLTTKEPAELIPKLEVLARGCIPPMFQRLRWLPSASPSSSSSGSSGRIGPAF